MSSPYNNFIVNNVATIPVQQPYVNSNVEVGYFSPTTTPIANWYSMNTSLLTTNGIAIQGSSTNSIAGLNILNAGIYKINLSFFPLSSTSNNVYPISFNFGTTRQVNNPISNPVNAFGGKGVSTGNGYGMYTFDNNYNCTYPGIISWLANGYQIISSPFTPSQPSNFAISAGELHYDFKAIGYSGTGDLYSSCCTTQITFILNEETTIYFNVSAGYTGVLMSNCYFTLELISYIPQYYNYSWNTKTISTANWSSISSDSTGTNLAAVVNGGYIYTSSNSGTNWIQQNVPPSANWQSIASSEDGTRLAAVSSAVSGVSHVYTGLYNGSSWTWTPQTAALLSGVSWGGIASDETGTILAAAGNSGIYRGVYNGSTWTWTQIYNLPTGWRSITSSGDGTKLAALVNGGDIYTGVYNDPNWNWTQQTTNLPVNPSWRSITSSKDGTRLAAVVYGGSIYTGYDDGSGFAWTLQTGYFPIIGNWTSITSSYDGTILAAASASGYIYTATLTNNVYTWSLPTSPTVIWISIASSEDGKHLAAVVTNGSNMYIGTFSNNTMSTIPYNNLGVNDLAIPPTRQPYVNSIVEVGYFSSRTVGNWYSMNTNLITNNGLATTVSVTAISNGNTSGFNVTGLKILNAGIYKITLSVFPILTNNALVNGSISYNFGYVPQYNTLTTNAVNAFGGAGFTSNPGFGMYTYDKTTNQNIPGIISWLPTGYTNGNFTKISATNELNYTYDFLNTLIALNSQNYYIANGICTSEITFFVTDAFITGLNPYIFLNVYGISNSTTSIVTMSNCYFTLELISTQYPT
jgi:hypothetical protein